MLFRATLLLTLLSFTGCIIHQAAPATPQPPATQSTPAASAGETSEVAPPPLASDPAAAEALRPDVTSPSIFSGAADAQVAQDLEVLLTSGTISTAVMCTRMGCLNGSCCNTCRLRLSFQPDGATPDNSVLLEGHGCRADGCGEITGCDLQEGPFTLPEGTTRQADGSLHLP